MTITTATTTDMPTGPPLIDAVAYFQAAILSDEAQRIERDRLIAAVDALRADGRSLRDIASILGISYGMAARATNGLLTPSRMWPRTLISGVANKTLPPDIRRRAREAMKRAVWRHSPRTLIAQPSDLYDHEFSAARHARETGATPEYEPERECLVFAPIAEPLRHLRSPLPITAQGVAHALGYLIDNAGHIYDADGVWIARDLEQLADALVHLDWVAEGGAGVTWSAFLDDNRGRASEETNDAVREAVAKVARTKG